MSKHYPIEQRERAVETVLGCADCPSRVPQLENLCDVGPHGR
jgi:hypothetical protein